MAEYATMSPTTWHSRLVLPVSAAHDHIRGHRDAPVTLLEYGGYQCHFCGSAHPVAKTIEMRIGDQMRFVFRHFPLTTVHPNAENAAEAAEAAGAQGEFWAMHDALYTHQQALDGLHLVAYATAFGLDIEQFTADLMDHTYGAKISEAFMSEVRSGLTERHASS
jgi:protein-disulfide isomerase